VAANFELNGEVRVARQAAVQHGYLPITKAEAGGDSFVACGGGEEGGDDFDLDSEALMWDSEGYRDPHLCREWNAATLEPMPQPIAHSSSDRITRLIGCSVLIKIKCQCHVSRPPFWCLCHASHSQK
jgi:hypothetical protein